MTRQEPVQTKTDQSPNAERRPEDERCDMSTVPRAAPNSYASR